MASIIHDIREELALSADEKTKSSSQKFFKEEIKCYGIKTGVVSQIAKKSWKAVKDMDKRTIFELCEELYASDYCEEAFIVSSWVPNLAKQFEPEDLTIFKRWIETYINNWAKCDSFCNHAVGDFIVKYPEYIEELKSWTGSDNRWLKRAAAVSLIVPAKRGKFLTDIFAIADRLLTDKDDMVQKGYGWLLKEASRCHQREIFDYVVSHKAIMPRTALRYAVELMPAELRAEAMRRD